MMTFFLNDCVPLRSAIRGGLGIELLKSFVDFIAPAITEIVGYNLIIYFKMRPLKALLDLVSSSSSDLLAYEELDYIIAASGKRVFLAALTSR